MEKKKNLQPEYYIRPMLEAVMSCDKQILREVSLLIQRFETVETYICSALTGEKKEKEYLTTQEVMEILHISRRTLLNFRQKGMIECTKTSKTIRFSKDQIESFILEGKEAR